MNRRTLFRVLAVVVALGAISPLLIEVDPSGGNQQTPSSLTGIQTSAPEALLQH